MSGCGKDMQALLAGTPAAQLLVRLSVLCRYPILLDQDWMRIHLIRPVPFCLTLMIAASLRYILA